MPFTLSHAAAALPALRTGPDGVPRGRGPLSAAGLVAGSLAPDAPFFAATVLPAAHRLGTAAHRPAGVLLLDPLLAAALAAGWSAVRAPLAALLPDPARGPAARLLGVGTPHRAAPWWFAASALAGAAGHVGWDAFTHAGRWGVRRLPVLDRPAAGVPLHHWAQYASSVAGLAALGGAARTALRRAPHPPAPAGVPRLGPAGRTAGRLTLTAATAAGALLRLRRDRPRGPSQAIASAAFGAGAGSAAGAAAVTLAIRARPGHRL